jgi:hypothetical protein
MNSSNYLNRNFKSKITSQKDKTLNKKIFLLTLLFLSYNIFSGEDNKKDGYIFSEAGWSTFRDKGIDHGLSSFFQIGVYQANKRIDYLINKGVESPAEKRAKKIDQLAALEKSVSIKNIKSIKLNHDLQAHILWCGEEKNYWDPVAKDFKKIPCGDAWKKWHELMKKITDENIAYYSNDDDIEAILNPKETPSVSVSSKSTPNNIKPASNPAAKSQPEQAQKPAPQQPGKPANNQQPAPKK